MDTASHHALLLKTYKEGVQERANPLRYSPSDYSAEFSQLSVLLLKMEVVLHTESRHYKALSEHSPRRRVRHRSR